MAGSGSHNTHLGNPALLEQLFTSSPDAILVADDQGRIKEANPQIERLFGYRCSELLGNPVEILIPERSRGVHPAHRSDYVNHPRVRAMGADLELYGRRKDGSEFPVDIMLSPMATAEGTFIVSVIRDITERKQKDQEVRNSRALFEDLFESCPDAIVETNRVGLIVRVNAQVESMFAYSRGELIGQPVNIPVPERFRVAHSAHQQLYHAAPRTRPMGAGLELFGRRKDGSEFPIDIMLSTLQTEGEPVALAVVRDVSQRKQTEQALRQSEQQFRSIVNSVKDYAIFLLDPEGRVTTWNPGAETTKGYMAEEILGRDLSCFYTEDDVARGKPGEALRTAAEAGRYKDEGWRVRKDGSRFWANVVVTAIKDADGKLLGFSKVTRDLTVRKKTEDALMLELSKSVLSRFDNRNLLSALSSAIQHVIRHDYAAVELPDRETNQLRVRVLEVGKEDGSPDEVLLPLKGSAPSYVFTHREPLVLNSFKDERFASETFEHLNAKGQKAGCWVPLVSEERVLGTLMVASRQEAAFTRKDIEVLSHLASQVAIAIDNMVAVGEFKRLSEKLTEENQRLEQEVRVLEEDLSTEYGFEEIIGDDVGLKRVLKDVETVAPTDATVLILGETGTGKELIARAIHQLSTRRERRIIGSAQEFVETQ